MSDSDSDSETEAELEQGQGPPGNVELPPEASDNARGPKAARKRAREMSGESRVVTRKQNGSPSSRVCRKESDRSKGGGTVKVFKG